MDDIDTIIKELIDRIGWSAGEVKWEKTNIRYPPHYEYVEGNTSEEPVLRISYDIDQAKEEEMSEEIFVAILEDRHTDDNIKLFRKPFHALKQITEWQHSYKDHYEWIEEEIEGWEYYCHARIDEGPKMRIEKKILVHSMEIKRRKEQS